MTKPTRKYHPDSKIIDAAGGPDAFAARISRHRLKITRETASMWRIRGIAQYARVTVIEFCKANSIRVPKRFLHAPKIGEKGKILG